MRHVKSNANSASDNELSSSLFLTAELGTTTVRVFPVFVLLLVVKRFEQCPAFGLDCNDYEYFVSYSPETVVRWWSLWLTEPCPAQPWPRHDRTHVEMCAIRGICESFCTLVWYCLNEQLISKFLLSTFNLVLNVFGLPPMVKKNKNIGTFCNTPLC